MLSLAYSYWKMLPRYSKMSFQNRETLGLVENSVFVYFNKENYLLNQLYIWNMFSFTNFFTFQWKTEASNYSSSSPPPYPQSDISNATFMTPVAEDLNSRCFSHLQSWQPDCIISPKMQHYLNLLVRGNHVL